MKRIVYDKIVAWHSSRKRKPLVLMGARQVGKTWLMEHFAAEHYPHDTVEVNLMRDELLRDNLDRVDLKPTKIVELIGLATGKRIVPGRTLLIIDEIQESMRALTALKFFCEEMPELAVMVAGSLLGVALRCGKKDKKIGKRPKGSFPVGKVDFLDVRPMTFGEFLDAMGEGLRHEKILTEDWELVDLQHEAYKDLLKTYYYVGGLPEAVADYVATRDFAEVRKTQKAILRAYDEDFEKHAESASMLAKLRLLWNNIPSQLAKENKKFIYTALREGARAREYEEALQWLDAAGMIHIHRNVETPRLPLKSYEDYSAFKLYLVDVGLLGAMSDLSARTLLERNVVFTNFKGALTEQYVLQELRAAELPTAYWTNGRGDAELDFVIQTETDVIPLEAKAETNVRAQSLKVYRLMFRPRLCVRTSLAERHFGTDLIDLPLYALERLKFLLSPREPQGRQ